MAQRTQAIALLFVTLLLVGCSRGAKVCAACQRDECKAMAFRITLDNGQTVETCCPRCGLHYSAGKPARNFEATDFATGHWMDATTATFVSGSDFRGCSTMETRRDAQGCCMIKGYDRCLPSLVGFAERPAALEFQKQHGGDVVAFAELTANKPSPAAR